jgi:hypothetical protein
MPQTESKMGGAQQPIVVSPRGFALRVRTFEDYLPAAAVSFLLAPISDCCQRHPMGRASGDNDPTAASARVPGTLAAPCASRGPTASTRTGETATNTSSAATRLSAVEGGVRQGHSPLVSGGNAWLLLTRTVNGR